MAGEHLDLTSEPYSDSSGKSPADAQRAASPRSSDSSKADSSKANSAAGRRFLGVTFACCDIYARIYVNKDETAYEGRCPRCCKPLLLRIGPGGVDARFFTAY